MSWFRVPHYHVLLREGYDVWTYQTAPATRACADHLYYTAHDPIILTCHYDGCQLYKPDDMSEEKIHARIDKERHAS